LRLSPGWRSHRLFPYATLATRSRNDGATGANATSFPGFTEPIALATYHAYRVINPTAGATTLALDIEVPHAPSRSTCFVGADGRLVRGLRVQGLLAPPWHPTVILEGSEAEVLALDPARPREVNASSSDGRYYAITLVRASDTQPKIIELRAASRRESW
jgi:hypothetical protein